MNKKRLFRATKRSVEFLFRPILLPLALAVSLAWALLCLPITFLIAPVAGFLHGYVETDLADSMEERKRIRDSAAAEWKRKLFKVFDLMAKPIEKLLDM